MDIFVFRFMSKIEFEMYLKGEEIYGKKQEAVYSHARNKSVVCFGICEYADSLKQAESEAKSAYEYMSGIVSDEICAIFKADENIFEKGWGRYADPYGSFFDTIFVDELMIESYNNKSFELLSYSDNNFINDDFEYNFIFKKYDLIA